MFWKFRGKSTIESGFCRTERDILLISGHIRNVPHTYITDLKVNAALSNGQGNIFAEGNCTVTPEILETKRHKVWVALP